MWRACLLGGVFILALVSVLGMTCRRVGEGAQTVDRRPSDMVLRHPSGFVFPIQIGVFQRGKVTEYEPSGHDVGYVYDHPRLSIHTTVYVYPRVPPNLKAHMSDLLGQMRENHPDMLVVSNGPAKVRVGGSERDALVLEFTTYENQRNVVQDRIERLILLEKDGYYIKFRLTYLASDADPRRKAVDMLMNAVAWPNQSRASR